MTSAQARVRGPAGFAGTSAEAWPRPRTFPRAEALGRPVDALPGVGPSVSKRLARLGLRTVGDLLSHRPFRYETPVPERRIADLDGGEEVAIAGEVLSVSQRRRGRLRVLAVAVVDEQHRFGVEQRRALAEGRSPHVLHMTATPIPRTLALTVYGDLQVSEIAKPPANRKPVTTSWVTQDRSSAASTTKARSTTRSSAFSPARRSRREPARVAQRRRARDPRLGALLDRRDLFPRRASGPDRLGRV